LSKLSTYVILVKNPLTILSWPFTKWRLLLQPKFVFAFEISKSGGRIGVTLD